jgi:peptide/nickel transport system substrate-binding protein
VPSIVQNLISEFDRIKRGFQKLRFFRFQHIYTTLRIFSRFERWAFVILLALFVLSTSYTSAKFYISHTVSAPGHGGEFSEGLLGSPAFINPILAQTQTDRDLTHLVFSGLYKTDQKGNIIPDLAESNPETSQDQKQYTIKIRKNLKWHDGQDLNAEDVVFTIQTLQNPDFKSPFRRLWQNTQVEKIDDHTVKFTNKDVSAPFLSNLTIGIIPKHVWSKAAPENFSGSKYNLEAIGSGPYLVREISKSRNNEIISITLDSFSNYWQGKPHIDRIVARFYKTVEDALFALHSKTITAFGFTPADQKTYVDPERTSFNVLQAPIFEYQALFFNLERNRALADKNVRLALSRSVDRDDLVNSVYANLAKPAYGPIMPGQIGYNPEVENVNSLDLNQANMILDQGGWVVNKDTGIRTKGGVVLSFTITTNDFILNVKSAENLRDQWKKINAEVKINVVQTAELERSYIRTRNYEALLFSESTGVDPDPFVFWHSSQSLNPGLNLSQYKNTEADRLIVEARNTLDPVARTEKYKQFQTVLATDIPALFLNESEFIYELNPDIKGTTIETLANPEDRFYDITKWYIETKRVWKK